MPHALPAMLPDTCRGAGFYRGLPPFPRVGGVLFRGTGECTLPEGPSMRRIPFSESTSACSMIFSSSRMFPDNRGGESAKPRCRPIVCRALPYFCENLMSMHIGIGVVFAERKNAGTFRR